MAVIWAPETASDFQRIYDHNALMKGENRAIEIESLILRHGNALTPSLGVPWAGGHPGERRWLIQAEGYWLFFRANGADVEIFAVFHARENWSVLIPIR